MAIRSNFLPKSIPAGLDTLAPEPTYKNPSKHEQLGLTNALENTASLTHIHMKIKAELRLTHHRQFLFATCLHCVIPKYFVPLPKRLLQWATWRTQTDIDDIMSRHAVFSVKTCFRAVSN
eukprot:4283408-Amphidinium_carterae.1